METQVPLASLLPVLPPAMAGQIKDIVGDLDGATVHRKTAVDRKAKPLDPGEREVLQYVSTRDIDREAEILDPDGCVLTEFKKAPQVLWGHDYSQPPIGSDRVIEADGYGIRAITKYAETDMGNDCWLLRRDGHLNTSSVGFVPMAATRKGDDGWGKLTQKLAAKWQMDVAKFEKADSVVTKWLLLEHSDVSVPANIYARTISVGSDDEGKQLEALLESGAIKSEVMCKSLIKTVAEIRAAPEKFKCECIECGHKLASEEHCKDIKCPKCGATMRREERPGPGQRSVIVVEPEAKEQPVSIRVVEPPRIIRVIDPEQDERTTRSVIRRIQGRL